MEAPGLRASHEPSTRLEIEHDGQGVVTVTLARPPVNAVDLLVYRELRDLFVDIDRVGPGVRALVLTGAGKHFCAGNDLDDFVTMDRDNPRERMFHVRNRSSQSRTAPFPLSAPSPAWRSAPGSPSPPRATS